MRLCTAILCTQTQYISSIIGENACTCRMVSFSATIESSLLFAIRSPAYRVRTCYDYQRMIVQYFTYPYTWYFAENACIKMAKIITWFTKYVATLSSPRVFGRLFSVYTRDCVCVVCIVRRCDVCDRIKIQSHVWRVKLFTTYARKFSFAAAAAHARHVILLYKQLLCVLRIYVNTNICDTQQRLYTYNTIYTRIVIPLDSHQWALFARVFLAFWHSGVRHRCDYGRGEWWCFVFSMTQLFGELATETTDFWLPIHCSIRSTIRRVRYKGTLSISHHNTTCFVP